jgi:phage virion morphogenesis protein
VADDLHALEHWVEPLLQRLSNAQRRKLTRSLAVGLRRRQADRIKAQRNPDGTPFEKRKPRKADKRGRIKKSAAMFNTLRQLRHMQTSSDANSAAVGFTGRSATIARTHQEGQLARVAPGGPLYHYPMRKLLGFTNDDREWLLQQLQRHLYNV